ncbi:MAG: hypothetical protein COW11_01485 [Candidatus Omnitrophica bacterium CG12_big_fil_rev_8_21_14_0_65_43_15]|uniref:Uncharacterized protein n=1 Tax=Candidatus Taenaricola geysiri TaxID=1974752 RepID=A0A2J0LG17_9BACT|nr:MAG: hypothetical protein AUJ89_02830 [Candidatus Omnitrophica bacterium CG1_02_43_210]PIR65584.1 MAG: hypothetical protein COU52_03475 [Candidatus Omnitrophica bacterium CG10_big_fil_rev_8_21_14_0_10_43_8]PIV12443.1 MAG: hypothetical protein COS48_00860 [Candidatus Omnitrophica bacterium CG03_land_8_20_14_0_80_43_22]PIW66792.1 MAG: hypothetical protein COW11_01485 [Candidatus Omnitrophica bacterium CG12_big_fil_rev_8_21_14_0_65_43_15]PIW80402.1 MAG: hypothetical protein COZ98_02385 [Candida
MIKHWMERKWIDYIICLAAPHIAIVVGLMFLATGETKEHQQFGLRIFRLSLIVMAAGSLIYYIFYTPMFGLD